ncbi:stage II sporulation protein M [Candidatus Woesearchaeota archaeon]|nr:stage II sporulation protein M [Candidatus Woesearchaeota archaeon]
MVIESIVNPFKARKKPYVMFFIGFVYSSLALFLAMWIFESHADLVTVFLTVMASMPFFYFTIKNEGDDSVKLLNERKLFKAHWKTLSTLLFLFLGMVVSFSFWYVIFPSALAAKVFSVQAQTIINLNQHISGNAVSSLTVLSRIFFNNVKVLVFCVLFSFIYGLGAVFILTWNASVIAVAIGNMIKNKLTSASVIGAVSYGLGRYLLHGLPEIAAYFVGGLAGGIISVAVVNYKFGSKKFEKILFDSSELLLLAILILGVAALLEVYVTPLLF